METNVFYLYDDQRILTQVLELPVTEPAPMVPYTLVKAPEVELPQVARFVDWLNEWEVLDERPPRPIPSAQSWQIDQEKERRVSMGFIYGGKTFETNSQSQMNDILGKMTDAMAAILIDQVDPSSLKWSDPDHDFAWSAADGSLVPMTAQECLEFTRAAVRRKEKLVAAALALKAMNPIPVDYYLDSYWPAMEVTSKAARK